MYKQKGTIVNKTVVPFLIAFAGLHYLAFCCIIAVEVDFMDKSKLALARAFDKVRQYEKSFEVCCTSFLDPAEQAEVVNAVRNVPCVLYGGYEDAERKILIVGTNECSVANDFLEIVSIECNETLTHRSVLGSVLGLGVKREMIGDIIINEKFADVIALKSISSYIVNNLKMVGREKVYVKNKDISRLMAVQKEEKETKIIVPSMRLDAVISGGFGISREKASNIIEGELVNLNYKLAKSNSKNVSVGDLISVRGHGRLEIKEIVGETRKNRIRITLLKK